MTTTWTNNGRKHVAQYGNWNIGRITEKMCKTNEPFLAVSMHGQVKDFLILQQAKDWIEGCAIDAIDAMETALDDE